MAAAFSAASVLATRFFRGQLARSKRHPLHLRDADAFRAAEAAIIAGGSADLVILIDFDRTITTYYADRERWVVCPGPSPEVPCAHPTTSPPPPPPQNPQRRVLPRDY